VPPYFGAMALPPVSSPRAAWRDLRAFFQTRQRHQWVFAALSLAIPGFLALQFYLVSGKPKHYRPPEVVFVQQWPKSRTDAEIKAQQAKDAPAEKAEQLERAKEEAAYRKRMQDLRKLLNP
jgi:hypothetical protein